ncbi:MAG TPA: hypothetical protein VG815_09620 [Chloroflexota bacterium]|jgi:hypothetical protein|nr:hypothetical protein [Chloroflexota bacterium]
MVEGRDLTSGDSFIMIGPEGDSGEDMYVSHESRPASPDDLNFIATSRNLVPRLLDEVERQRRGNE